VDIATIWKLIGLGLEVDLEKKSYTVKLGPLTLKGISFKTVKALSSQPAAIEDLLSKHFIQRGVMFADFRRESIDDCIRSLRELQTLNQTQSTAFLATKKPEDILFSTMLSAWANECDKAVTYLQSALEDERDPINTGMDVSARDAIPGALGDMRKAAYPTVELFVQLLPEGNPVKVQATASLAQGKDVLVRHFGVAVSELVAPEVEPQ
jgi:hypothetical protein